jgi:uncharacterized protein
MTNPLTRPAFARVLTVAAAVFATGTPAGAAVKTHRTAFQVSANDPAVMNLALNNINALATYYATAGEPASIELVAYGPGLNMLRDDTSPVKARLADLKGRVPGLVFSACHNTMAAMEKAEGHPIPIVAEAQVVPAGVVRLTELQEQNWAYIKP